MIKHPIIFLFLFVLLPFQSFAHNLEARKILEAWKDAYPDKIQEVLWQDGDWSLVIGTTTFFWASGRILPQEEREHAENWRPYVFYNYAEKPNNPEDYSPERIEQLREAGKAEVRWNGLPQHPDFMTALFGGAERIDAEASLRKTTLFGKQVTVHKDILKAVQRVDSTVQALAQTQASIRSFLASIKSLGGYNWRDIRGTERRSYHSWGLAIDVQPRSLGGKATYWEWERVHNPDWMLVPLTRRWAPPEQIIHAFEEAGFIWGGNWDFYDTMHFEYRPELLLLRAAALR